MNLLQAFYELISNDSAVAAQLGQYDFGSGSVPAVFTVDPAPSDTPGPLVTITQTAGSPNSGRDRGHRGGDVDIAVSVWGPRDGSTKATYETAEAIWRLVDRATLTIDNYETPGVMASPPFALSDPDGFPGYQILVRVILHEIVESTS